jgi:hypothetical protein
VVSARGAHGAVEHGTITVGNAPGLGLEPLVESFGPPFFALTS